MSSLYKKNKLCRISQEKMKRKIFPKLGNEINLSMEIQPQPPLTVVRVFQDRRKQINLST